MPQIRYVGPFDMVILPAAGRDDIAPGDVVDVPDVDEFASLCAQADWEAVTPSDIPVLAAPVDEPAPVVEVAPEPQPEPTPEPTPEPATADENGDMQ